MSEVMTSRIGRFEILDSLGDSVAGNHYRAFDPATDRNVAVETFRLETLPSDAARETFVQGLKRSAHLLHARIASVYDVGVDNDVAYVASESLSGKSLGTSMLEYGPFQLGEIAMVIRQIGAALDYAHEQGVVHGGLEPGRVLVLENGDVKVTGFGADFPEVRTAQGAHTFVGEPKYFAPERVRGEALTHRADIFSLGAIVYELLTGQAPFDSESLITSLYRVVNEPHTPARTLRPSLPEGIDEVLDYALAKQPKDRYLSCATLVDSLEALIPAAVTPAVTETESLMADAVTQYCDQCGSELQSKMKFCWSCGATVAMHEAAPTAADATPLVVESPAAKAPATPPVAVPPAARVTEAAPVPIPVPVTAVPDTPIPVPSIDRSAETAPVDPAEAPRASQVTSPSKAMAPAPKAPVVPVVASSASTSKGNAVRSRATTAMDAVVGAPGGLDGLEEIRQPLEVKIPARTEVATAVTTLPPPLSGYAMSTGTKDLPAPGVAIDAAPAKPSKLRAMAPLVVFLLILVTFAVLGFLFAPRFLGPKTAPAPAESSTPVDSDAAPTTEPAPETAPAATDAPAAPANP